MTMQDLKTSFANKRILITGHTGFVGSWLCATLSYFNANIYGYSLKEEEGSLFEKIKDSLNVTTYYGDLCDINSLEKCMKEVRPDIIIHLAAFGFVHECKIDPYRTFSSNVMGTVNLMETIRKNTSVKSLIAASSDKVYKNPDNEVVLFSETDPLGGNDPYSCSKTCEDLIIQSYYDTYFKNEGKNVTILRPGNIIGGGDHNYSRLIPSLILGIMNDESVEIRNPDAIRPWQFIMDAIDAYVYSAANEHNKTDLHIYNVGPNNDNVFSVKDIVDIIYSIKKSSIEKMMVNNNYPNSIEKQYLGLSIDKILDQTGWKPHTPLTEALFNIYAFYENDENVYDLCMNTISNYYNKYMR